MFKRLWFFSIVCFALIAPVESHAQNLGKLISPGDLSSLHKEIEGIFNCTQCHALRGGIPNEKCLECHKKIKKRIDEKHGLHATMIKDKCVKCHLDHKGRDFKMVTLDEKKFDHDQAGFKLKGKHIKTKCLDCHKVKTKKGQISYLDLKEACISCHKDIHKGQLDEKCEKCHNANSWKGNDVKLDHDKAYKLRGGHATKKIKCQDCHKAKGLFKVKGFEKCITCHKKDDVHKEKLGDKCESCHTDKSWKDTLLFDHTKTKYKLEGKHRKVKCAECHPKQKKGIFAVEKYDTCSSSGCHDTKKRGKIHGKQFKGQRCDECHTVKGWKPTLFKHKDQKYEGYKLEGKHAKVKCESCHTKSIFKRVVNYKPIDTKTCNAPGCHDTKKRGLIHGDQFKDQLCADCHTVKEWKPSDFKHEDKKYKGYKLKGKHADVKCAKCHIKDRFDMVLFKPVETKGCGVSCHKDEHKGLFKDKACDVCHTEEDWKTLVLDHNRQSKFPLFGKHAKADCEKCHVKKVWKPLPLECIDCHKKEDVHKGKLGNQCEECHNAADWQPKKFFHELTGFDLLGAHGQMECVDCHEKKGMFSGLSSDCVRCHIDPHFNQFGSFCEDCHTASNWGAKRFRHNETGFRLEGVHRITDCEDCHKNRFYRNTPIDCYECHQAEFTTPRAISFHDPGKKDCEECHKVYSWSPAIGFGHRSMTFSGAHKEIEFECEKCHLAGASDLKFPGAANEGDCSICHSSDFGKEHANGDPPGLPACPQTCDLCHDTRSFMGAKEIIPCD